MPLIDFNTAREDDQPTDDDSVAAPSDTDTSPSDTDNDTPPTPDTPSDDSNTEEPADDKPEAIVVDGPLSTVIAAALNDEFKISNVQESAAAGLNVYASRVIPIVTGMNDDYDVRERAGLDAETPMTYIYAVDDSKSYSEEWLRAKMVMRNLKGAKVRKILYASVANEHRTQKHILATEAALDNNAIVVTNLKQLAYHVGHRLTRKG